MSAKPVILCVDDDRHVVDGLRRTLGRHYRVLTALSGFEGLEVLEVERDVAVVISDMRMPEMDGGEFLAKVRQSAPDIVRILLTGEADIADAARAVNAGRIFLFLRKPCPTEDLSAAVASAVEMHHLITQERVLLQQTLVGCVGAVVNTLGITTPMALGRALRIRELARKAAQGLESEDRWRIEFAALLSQLSTAALPKETMEKYYAGQPLEESERAKLAESMAAVNKVLSGIPRLESVTRVLGDLKELTESYGTTVHETSRISPDARLLKAIIDLEALESRGQSPAQSLGTLRARVDIYGAKSLEVLGNVARGKEAADDRACLTSQLEPGMVLAEDLNTRDGTLLLPRGFELSQSALAHIVARFQSELPPRVRIMNTSADTHSNARRSRIA